MSQYNNSVSGNLAAQGTYTQTDLFHYSNGACGIGYDGAGIWVLYQVVEGDPQSQYEAFADQTAFPLTGWTTTNGLAPVPEFTVVDMASSTSGSAAMLLRRR